MSFMDIIKKTLQALFLALMALSLAFIFINFFMGCDDWSNEEACLTPTQIYEAIHD